jgi:hypothetical protein
MDYTKIITDAWDTAWKHRYLWIFGLVAGLGGGLSIPGGGDNARQKELTTGALSWLNEHPGLLAAAILGGTILLLIHLILYFISYGALIKGAAQIEQEGKGNFDSALNAGLKYFWPNAGIAVLTGLIALGAVVMIGLPFAGMLLAGGGLKIAAVIWLIVWVLPLILGLFVLGLVAAFAARICVLEDRGVWDSFKSAWQTCRTSVSESATLGAIMIALGIGTSMAMTLAVIALAIPFIVLGLVNLWLGLIPGGLVLLVLLLLMSCVYGVFASAYWTLGYLRIKNKSVPAAPATAAVPPAGEVV